MTVPLAPDSPRAEVARRFGDELRKAMVKRQVGMKVLRVAADLGSTNSINEWRHGRNLPSLASAIRIAEALQWPKLIEIAQMGRMSRCVIDDRPFVNEGGQPKLYCSAACRRSAAAGRVSTARDDGFRILRGELLRVGPVSKQQVGKALSLLEDAIRGRDPASELAPFKAAVDAMCGACEPDGYCRTADCPLRTVSNWPLLVTERVAEVAEKPVGGHTPEINARRAASNRAVWAARDAAAREAQTRPMREAKDAMSPEARAEMGRRIGAKNAARNRERASVRRSAVVA